MPPCTSPKPGLPLRDIMAETEICGTICCIFMKSVPKLDFQEVEIQGRKKNIYKIELEIVPFTANLCNV